MDKFYLTTSIPYVNAAPHIGHVLEYVQADALARYQRQVGKDVHFLTGSDEHGTKIEKAATDRGVDPADFAKENVDRFVKLLSMLDVTYDDFIRTTDQERHWPSVRFVWERSMESGDIYKASYEGLYCSGCEAFLTEHDLQDGMCPNHKKEPERVKEENYFFRLSKYANDLKKAIENEEFCIVPPFRANEILQLIDQGVEDLSVSRPKDKLSWGVPVPGDDSQTMYVWVDALTNYISALGYPDGEMYEKYWPADVHMVGKDILRFHALIWPAILMSVGVPLPKKVFAHGFVTVEGQKMSKSLGNVVDPFELIEKYGSDPVRYYFLREVPATQDGDFSEEKFKARYNGDLAAGLGNLSSRVLTMSQKNGIESTREIENEEMASLANEVRIKRDAAMEEFDFSNALQEIWGLIHACDRFIEQKRPWEASDDQKHVLSSLLGSLYVIAELVEPFLPQASSRLYQQLDSGERGDSLFPRL